MFLAERLVGISVYLTLLIGAYYLISRLQFKQVKYMLFIYLMAISVVAFLYVPAAEADLYRLTQYMFEYASYSQEGFYATLIESAPQLH